MQWPPIQARETGIHLRPIVGLTLGQGIRLTRGAAHVKDKEEEEELWTHSIREQKVKERIRDRDLH